MTPPGKSAKCRRAFFTAIIGTAFAPGSAQAHVKWFAPYDMHVPPRPIGDVFDGRFLGFFLASIVMVVAFFIVDRALLRRGLLVDWMRQHSVREPIAFGVMRVAIILFLSSVSAYGFAGHGFYLTPELRTGALWVPVTQALIALSALHRRTIPLVGLGLFVLYGAALWQYGLFHLLDYLILVGVAFFFLVSALPGEGWVTARYLTLFATTGLTLLWASIEKWGYPGWTYPMLRDDPSLLMGLSPETFMVLAGWVEFNVTYLLLSAASPVSRVIALGFAALFTLAIYKFGVIDAIGHLLIITILVILVVYGPTRGRNILVLDSKLLVTEAYFMVGNYCFWLVMVFVAYYSLHWAAYGN